MGTTYREDNWSWTSRFEFRYAENEDKWGVVNNMNANFKPDHKTQIALQYGLKYVRDTIDGDDYSGFTDLIGLEARYDLNERWDVGIRGSVLHVCDTKKPDKLS